MLSINIVSRHHSSVLICCVRGFGTDLDGLPGMTTQLFTLWVTHVAVNMWFPVMVTSTRSLYRTSSGCHFIKTCINEAESVFVGLCVLMNAWMCVNYDYPSLFLTWWWANDANDAFLLSFGGSREVKRFNFLAVIQTKHEEEKVLLLPLWTLCNKPATITFHLTKCSFRGNFIVAALLNEERGGRNKERDGRLCFSSADWDALVIKKTPL